MSATESLLNSELDRSRRNLGVDTMITFSGAFG